MTSTITTKHFESAHKPGEVLKPIGNLWQQRTPVNKNSASTAINSSEANLEREREAVATSSEGVETSQKYGNETSLPVLESTTPVSTEEHKLDEGGDVEEEEFEDDLEHDSEDDFPKFEGGEPRGRVVNPTAGTKPIRPK